MHIHSEASQVHPIPFTSPLNRVFTVLPLTFLELKTLYLMSSCIYIDKNARFIYFALDYHCYEIFSRTFISTRGR